MHRRAPEMAAAHGVRHAGRRRGGGGDSPELVVAERPPQRRPEPPRAVAPKRLPDTAAAQWRPKLGRFGAERQLLTACGAVAIGRGKRSRAWSLCCRFTEAFRRPWRRGTS